MSATPFSALADFGEEEEIDEIINNVEQTKISSSPTDGDGFTEVKKKKAGDNRRNQGDDRAKGNQKNKNAKGKNDRNDPDLSTAMAAFDCNQTQLAKFEKTDPLNFGTDVRGFICKKDGPMMGSLFLTHVNDAPYQQLIYGTPKTQFPLRGSDEDEGQRRLVTLPKFDQICFTTKWNGTNILFFKYHGAQGETYISAKTRGTAFLEDGASGNFLSLVKQCLKIESSFLTPMSSDLPQELIYMRTPNVQCMSMELVGRDVPHLVRYNFNLKLEPLFLSYMDGSISPIMNPTDPNFPTLPTLVPSSQWNYDELAREIHQYRQEAFRVNEKFRQENSLKTRTWFEHFAVEGHVMYLLNEQGLAVSRESLYKIKPKDIATSHWEIYDHGTQLIVLEAMHKILDRGEQVNKESLQVELNLNDVVWEQFGKDIIDTCHGITKPSDRSAAPGAPRVLVLLGIPGSGKSTVAKRLVEMGWDRVNQDEMGTRPACERAMQESLKKNRSVVVDRCNFDIAQRHTWIQIAHKFKVTQVDALHLKVPAEVCKERLKTRKDHPTIKDAIEGANIIDKFGNMFREVSPYEGFANIYVASNDAELEAILKTLNLIEII